MRVCIIAHSHLVHHDEECAADFALYAVLVVLLAQEDESHQQTGEYRAEETRAEQQRVTRLHSKYRVRGNCKKKTQG